MVNLKSFNEILFHALKDDTSKGKLEFLKAELEIAFSMALESMQDVIDDLNKGRRYQDHLRKTNALIHSCDNLIEQIEEIIKEHPELKESRGAQA